MLVEQTADRPFRGAGLMVMIYYLATERALYTIFKCVETWTAKLGGRLVPVSYPQLLASKRWPAGTYVFSDLDRLAPDQAGRVAELWDRLARQPGTRLLNHPTRSLQRYELLRHLHEMGRNCFNVHRLSETRRPGRFPVFLRTADDHKGATTALLASPEALEREIECLVEKGEPLGNKLMIEFCDTSDPQGIYRKYSAYLIGEQIIPSMVSFRPDWHVKVSTEQLGRSLHAEKVDFLKTNPHREELRRIFRLARIEYGRMDYGLLDGRVQTWEINTNPDISSICTRPSDAYNQVDGIPFNQYLSAQFEQAFAALDDGPAPEASPLDGWHEDKVARTIAQMEEVIPDGSRVLWAGHPGDEGLEREVAGRPLVPFLERGGVYWGLPLDDAAAIEELERERAGGADFLVFGWASFWWFEYYPGFFRHLQSRYIVRKKSELVFIVELRGRQDW